MSGPAAATGPDLLADLAQHLTGPVLEYGGWRLAAASGGQAVTPWRRDARAAGALAVGCDPELLAGTWRCAAVHLARGKAGVQADLAAAWRRLAPGGVLAVEGANAYGAASWIRRLQEWGAGAPLATVARAHCRAAVFARGDHPGPPPPEPQPVPAEESAGAPRLVVPAGCFSGDGLDRGTAALLAHLAAIAPARRILDLGCGAGHFGLWCLRAWPDATAVLSDADARAVAGAHANAAALGVAARCTPRWADEHDALGEAFDLVLLNPPAHAGNEVDLAAGLALTEQAAEAVAPGGRLLLVANRRLPYESSLSRYGRIALAAERDGFKVIELLR